MRRPQLHTRSGSLLVSVGASILRWLFQVLGRTCRVDVVRGREHLDELLRAPRPVLLSFWHNRTFLGAHFVFEGLHRRGLEITLLASQSRDGELVTRTFRRWGIHTVRGSASRGGREAMRSLYRAVSRHGRSPIMIPDGPRGPVYEFKVGVAVLAQMSKAPILPMGFAVRKSWRIKSWDRMIVPWPFSRITLTVGAPQTVARDLSAAELEAERRRLQDLLDELTLEAESAAGTVDALRDR
jgi:lysophospholipid acyltransferase (LPLAT)-like uncharacterized protein